MFWFISIYNCCLDYLYSGVFLWSICTKIIDLWAEGDGKYALCGFVFGVRYVIASVLVLVVNDNVLAWLRESENGWAMGGGITSAVSWYRIHNTPFSS